jgi:hypothetical protein
MKITIDMDAFDIEKQAWLLKTLEYTQIPFTWVNEEDPWSEEEIKEYNRELDEADAAYERGEYLTMEEVENEIENWKNAKSGMERVSLKATARGL